MSLRDLLDENAIVTGLRAASSDEVIDRLAGLLRAQGKVKAEFAAQVKAREAVFPTGLPTAGVKVAIPHTDAAWVCESAMAVGICESPVSFQVMGSPAEAVDVNVVFLLAIRDKEAQAETLMQLIGLVQNEELLASLLQDAEPRDVYVRLLRHLSSSD